MTMEAPSEEFQENMRLAVASHLGLRNDTPMDEMVDEYLALPQQTQLKILSGTMTKSKISPYDLVLKECDSKRHLPLARVRDRENAPFSNLQCNSCGKGKEAAGVENFERCGRCKTVMYCNKQCQIRDWKGMGHGPTPLSHKITCAELGEALQEFANDPVNGAGLRTHLFASWADQHHESGAFFRAEFLARRGLLGQRTVGFWAIASHSNPYAMVVKDPTSGFYNGDMLFQSQLPSLEKGWMNLSEKEFPSGPPNKPPPDEGVRSWEEYMLYRELSTDSIAPILLTNVLTIYQMIRHELKLTTRGKNKGLFVYLLGPEIELNHIPIFGELAYLLPNVDLTLKWVGPAVKGVCQEAHEHHPDSIIVRNNNTVLDVRHPNQEGRLRIELVPDVEYYHQIPEHLQRADAVLGLNVGLDAYNSWMNTLANIFYNKAPFAFSDQTKIGLRTAEITTFPRVIEGCKSAGPRFSQVSQPSVEIKLNPFHGVIGRDVSAVLVPNLDNGYLLVSSNE